jgi:hypothetical protein
MCSISTWPSKLLSQTDIGRAKGERRILNP